MILAAMYFVLGLLTAILLVIFALPRVWKRAERLTTRRIEAELPLSWAELQAEKDRIRADYAVETRRAEFARDKLQTRALEQSLLLKERQDELNAANRQIEILQETIADFEDRIEEARNTTLSREEEVNRLAANLKQTERSRDTSDSRQKEKSAQLAAVQRDNEESRLQIATLRTALETMTAQHEELKTQQSTDAINRAALESELQTASASLKRETGKQAELQGQLDQMASTLERRDLYIKQLENRPATKSQTEANDELQKLKEQLRQSEMKRLETEARLAALTLRSSNFLTDNDGELDTLTTLEKSRMELEQKLKGAETRQKSLEQTIKNLKRGSKTQNSRQSTPGADEAVLDQINDIAAHVIKLAAAQDASSNGDDSLNNKIRKLAAAKPAGRSKARNKTLTEKILSR